MKIRDMYGFLKYLYTHRERLYSDYQLTQRSDLVAATVAKLDSQKRWNNIFYSQKQLNEIEEVRKMAQIQVETQKALQRSEYTPADDPAKIFKTDTSGASVILGALAGAAIASEFGTSNDTNTGNN